MKRLLLPLALVGLLAGCCPLFGPCMSFVRIVNESSVQALCYLDESFVAGLYSGQGCTVDATVGPHTFRAESFPDPAVQWGPYDFDVPKDGWIMTLYGSFTMEVKR